MAAARGAAPGRPRVLPAARAGARVRRLRALRGPQRAQRARSAPPAAAAAALALTPAAAPPRARSRAPQVPIQVPLWMAVALAQRAKCAIQPPPWMEPASLEEVLRRERESEAEFQARPARSRCAAAAPAPRRAAPRGRSARARAHAQRARPPHSPSLTTRTPLTPLPLPQPLPFHYIEVATALFKHAGDAFGERRQRVYDLVENIRSVRFNKIEKGMRRLDGASAAYIRLNNVSAMEVNLVRPFIVTALNRFAHTAAIEAAAERGALAAAAAAGRRAAGGGAAGGAAAGDRPRRQLPGRR